MWPPVQGQSHARAFWYLQLFLLDLEDLGNNTGVLTTAVLHALMEQDTKQQNSVQTRSASKGTKSFVGREMRATNGAGFTPLTALGHMLAYRGWAGEASLVHASEGAMIVSVRLKLIDELLLQLPELRSTLGPASC